MGWGAWWALGPLMNCSLWDTSLSQRPPWYYGGLELPFGKGLGPTQGPRDLPACTQRLLWSGYSLLLVALTTLAVSSLAFLMRRFVNTRRKQGPSEPPQEGDPEEVALMEALHLLDVMMETTRRHLCRLQRERRGRPEAEPGS